MERNVELTRESGGIRDALHGAEFVLSVYQTHHADVGIWPRDNSLACAVDSPPHSASLLGSSQDRGVFDGSQQHGKLAGPESTHSDVVGFGATRQKHDGVGSHPKRVSSVLPSVLQDGSCASTPQMQAARIAWA